MARLIETLRIAIRIANPVDDVRHLGFGYYAAYENGVEIARGKFAPLLLVLHFRAMEVRKCLYFGARVLYIARVHAQKYATRTDAFATRVKEAAAWLATFTREKQAKLAPRV